MREFEADMIRVVANAAEIAPHLPEIERLAWQDTPDWDNWCGNACGRVSEYLKAQGFPHYIGSSAHHTWLELPDGTIIDPTITQFLGEGHPRMQGHPLTTERTAIFPPDHPQQSAEWYNDEERTRWPAHDEWKP